MSTKGKPNDTKKISLLTIGIIIVVVLIIALIIYGLVADKRQKDGDTQQTVIDTNTGQAVDLELLEVYRMDEYERIRYYFGKYAKALEAGDYESAYNLLHKDFKGEYFKTLEDFTKYVQRKYLPIISVEYGGVVRLGAYYVMTINFLDLFNSTDEETVIAKTQKFIIYENNYNDFVMSFQAE